MIMASINRTNVNKNLANTRENDAKTENCNNDEQKIDSCVAIWE